MDEVQKATLRRAIQEYGRCRARESQWYTAYTAIPHVPMVKDGLDEAVQATQTAWNGVCVLIDAA